MITIKVPGKAEYNIHHVVFDFNGTLARDGLMTEPVRKLLLKLTGRVTVHVVTADTFGTVSIVLKDLPVKLKKLDAQDQIKSKTDYVKELNSAYTVSVGNGHNDSGMLSESAIGICINGPEGAAKTAVLASDLIVSSPEIAIGLLLNPLRIAATLRC